MPKLQSVEFAPSVCRWTAPLRCSTAGSATALAAWSGCARASVIDGVTDARLRNHLQPIPQLSRVGISLALVNSGALARRCLTFVMRVQPGLSPRT